MKVEFHPEAVELQQYTCKCCGRGCRSFLVPVRPAERAAIEKLRDWRRELGVDELFVHSRAAGPAGAGLAKRPDGACVFLDADNLCLIHKQFGLKAKPLACQLFPFVFTPFNGTLRVGLRFDCPGVCENQGKVLTQYRAELNGLAAQLVPPGIEDLPVPPLLGRVRVDADWLDTINEALVAMASSNALPLAQRLHWMARFLAHLERVKWRNVPDEDFQGLIDLFRGGTLAELQRREPSGEPLAVKARHLLGQYFFLLCVPPNAEVAGGGLWAGFKRRLAFQRQMSLLGRPRGPLPPVQPHWPDGDLAELENDWPGWPDDVQAMVGRYLTCRFTGMNYFGPNFYGYSLVEGARSLLIAAAVVGWVMRIEARAAGRNHFELADAHQAVMTIDGNLGYSSALAVGPARWRLDYLKDHLDRIIDTYVGP